MDMIEQLRDVAIKKGDIGYQQLIKIFITDGFFYSKTAPISERVKSVPAVTTIPTQGSSQSGYLEMPPAMSGERPEAA